MGHTQGWSPEEIRSRLGISTAIYQRVRLGAAQIAAIRAAGIERVELLVKAGSFEPQNPFQVTEVLGEVHRQGMTVVSVHGSLELDYRSEDEDVRSHVMAETLETVRFAEEAGASVFVAHFGAGDRAREIVEALLDQTTDLQIVLTTETMGGDLARYLGVVDRVGSDRFGLTVDIGHPRDEDGINPFVKPGRAREALVACGPRVRHLHLHETFDLEAKADHHPPLHPNGIIEWGDVFDALREIEYEGSFLFEDGRGEDPEGWIRATGAFPEVFADRYGV